MSDHRPMTVEHPEDPDDIVDPEVVLATVPLPVPDIEMRLWKLQPADAALTPWGFRARGFVVRAVSEEAARRVVVEHADDELIGTGGEGAEAWLDPAFTACTPIPVDGPPEIIMRDFRPG